MHPNPSSALAEFISGPDFPCVGAKSALGKGQLKTFVARSIDSAWNDVEIQDRLMPLHDALFFEPNPQPSKAALAMLGLCRNEVRSPLLTASPACEEVLAKALRHAGLLN